MAINSFSTVFEARERKFQTEKIFQGEDVDLVARITNDGVPQDLTGYSVTGYYQPTDYPGTDQASLFYSLTAEISQDKKEVIVHWTYDKDFGKQGYMVWALLSKGTEHVYPVAWKVNLAHSPGYPAGETPEPIPQTIDFNDYTLLNAPWLPLAGGTCTGDVTVNANLTANKVKSSDIAVNDANFSQVYIGNGAGATSGHTNHGGIAIGASAKTSGNGSVAMGMGAQCDGGEIAIGINSNARGQGGIAIGTAALTNKWEGAEGSQSICIGNDAFARGADSIAIGKYARVMENADHAIQIGGTSGFSCNNDVPWSVQFFNQQCFQAVGDPAFYADRWNLVLVKERAPWAVQKNEYISFLATDWSGNPDMSQVTLFDIAQRVNQCVAAIKGAAIPKGTLPTDLPGLTHLYLTDGTEVTMDVTTINEGTIDDYLIDQGYSTGRNMVRSIVVGSAVDVLGHHAFAGFPELAAVDCSRATLVTGYLEDRMFQYNPKLTYVVLPPNVTQLRATLFQNTPMLTEITIPSAVTTIGTWALANGGIEKVTFTGKTKAQVQAMTDYAWRMSGKTFVASDGSWTA